MHYKTQQYEYLFLISTFVTKVSTMKQMPVRKRIPYG